MQKCAYTPHIHIHTAAALSYTRMYLMRHPIKLMHAMNTHRANIRTAVQDVIDSFNQKKNISSCQVQVFHHRDVSKSLNLYWNICLCIEY